MPYYYKLYLASFSFFFFVYEFFYKCEKLKWKNEYFVANSFIGHQTQELIPFVCTLHRLQNYNLLVKIIKNYIYWQCCVLKCKPYLWKGQCQLVNKMTKGWKRESTWNVVKSYQKQPFEYELVSHKRRHVSLCVHLSSWAHHQMMDNNKWIHVLITTTRV